LPRARCALRDALGDLGALSGVGDAHAGARVRTRDAAVVGTVARLAWVWGLDRPWQEPREGWQMDEICAANSTLASLQWARANSCDWSLGTCGEAVPGGQLEVMQWARVNGCD
jgi:hypothetical protein